MQKSKFSIFTKKMQPLPNLTIIATFILMGIGFLIPVVRITGKPGGMWGRPSISPFFFYTAKITMFLSWGLFLFKAIVPSFGSAVVPFWMAWTAVVLFCPGAAILVLSFYSLGTSLKYGLPEEETQLKTTGIYRFSRHPLYLGMFMVLVASALFFPDLPNLLLVVYCMVTHAFIIRAEECFLADRFGREWENYKARVRRFI